MSNTNELLKNLSAKIEEANGKFNAKAEEALKEAQKVGSLSAETKAAVDQMATELNALRESEKTLKASLGELEQHVAQMPLTHAIQAAKPSGSRSSQPTCSKTLIPVFRATSAFRFPFRLH